MKLQIMISIFGLTLLFSTATIAQEMNAENKPDMDPKLSLKEQLAILEASKGTPAKVEVVTDPKMIEEFGFDIVKETGPTDYNAELIVDEKPVVQVKTNANMGSPAANSGLNSTQPEPQKIEDVTNYRTINGSQQQAIPEKSGNSNNNYRQINGPQDQPEGKPGHK
jgi:hypothetical protein